MKNKYIQRFWERTQTKGPDDCWVWTGCKDSMGYGVIYCEKRTIKAHRLSMMIFLKRILSKEEHVLHKCDNPICVNPNHLFIGNMQINNEDMYKKKRNPRGERHGMAKLTEKDVKEIRKEYGTKTRQELATKFGVGVDAIARAAKAVYWKDVSN